MVSRTKSSTTSRSSPDGSDVTTNAHIPLVTICYNNHRYVENTVLQAARFGIRTIILDNASGYADTRAYLAGLQERAEVIFLPDNAGHTCWTIPSVYNRLPDRFFLSDPDLEWNPTLPADFPTILDGLRSELQAGRIGFALDLSDSGAMFQDPDYVVGTSISAWEAQFWTSRVLHPTYEIYNAPIDTTFHLFDKQNTGGRHIRLGGIFTARHLPWYRETDIPPHDLLHMYAASRGSTISKLVLREMARKDLVQGALDECRRKCGDSAFLSAAALT